jgi:transcriptional regulator with XRE-family HTH domain
MQLRHLRERRGLKQSDLKVATGMSQSAVSRIEQADYAGWTYKTLLKMAEALDAELRITFVPAEDVIAEQARKDASRSIAYTQQIARDNTSRAATVRRERWRVGPSFTVSSPVGASLWMLHSSPTSQDMRVTD